MPSVGYATLQVIPSVRGISDEIRRQLVGPAGDAGGQAGQAAGSGLLDKLKVGAAAAGVAAGALLVKGLTDAVDQANVTSRLQAQLGTSNKVAAQQGKLAGKLYSSGVTDSFESAADAIKSVMQSGLAPPGATTKQLQSLATKASDVANVFDQDLGGVTSAIAQMMRTGLAKNSTEAFDLITKGFQSGADKAGDLLDTVNEYGTQFRKAGLDGATSIGLINQGLKAGARDGDLVADSIKEFSIRAIDGSKSTSAGFKTLGLNAESMAAKFGKGGQSASAALDTTLDRLRNIKDPVKQSQTAVALFGTQAEDLGKALFALDPSKAAQGLGQVGGAAQKVGDTIRSGPSHEIQVFTRTLQQGFVEFLGGKVLPIVSQVAHGFNATLLPPLRTAGTVVAATLIPALKALWEGGAAVIKWLQDMGTWLIPIGIAVVGFTAAILAQQIATAATTAVFSIYRGAILAWTAVQRVATIAQAAFNAVMEANPVILVITAILALAAAFYVAYQRSETFRSIVQAAWAGIQTAAMFVWTSVLKPMFAALMAGLSAVGAAFTWLWSAVKAAFNFIMVAGKVLAVALALTVFLPITLGVIALSYIFPWLWTHAIKPAFSAIAAGAMSLWSGVQVAFGYIMAGLRAVGRGATWLWTNAISPAIHLIVAGLGVLWSGAKVIFGFFISGLKAVGGAAKLLWTGAVSPALHGIQSVISTVYNSGIKPVLSTLKTAIGQVAKAFGTAKDAIKIAWDKVSGIARKPVAFIVNTVYGKGIRPVWNKVASAFGAPELPAFKFAAGGIMPGYTPGRDVHLAALSGGEAIMRPEWTRAMGPGYVSAMNGLARRGGIGAIRSAMGGGLPAYKDGGIFGWIGSGASKVAGWGSAAWDKAKAGAAWLKDTLAASARAGVNHVVEPLLKLIPGLDTGFGKMIAEIPRHAVDALFGYADKADKKGASDSFGGGKIPSGQHAAIIKRALSAAGVPPPGTLAQWLSGLNTLITRESGWNSKAINRTDSNAKAGTPSQGLAQTIPGTFNAYVPSSLKGRGILDPVANVAAAIRYIVSRYGSITKVQQANASKSPKGYANGGSPRAGEIFWVGENGPELMRLGPGGATVWDSATSMGMASGLGTLRGFAKGTSSAKSRAAARKQVPGDLTSAHKALTGSASDIKKAFDELTKDLKAAGGSAKGLADSSKKASSKLQTLAKQRDSTASRLASARQAATDQKGTASDYLSLSNVSDSASVKDVIAGLTQRQSGLKSFQATIKTLSQRGLSQSMIQQLVAMGPDSQLAGLIAQGGSGSIKQLNALAKSGATLSTSYGRTMADAMYDAGANASKGFLAGLQSQDKQLQAAMNRLGSGLVNTIKKKLKIHSPSRVTQPLGAYTGEGFAIGLDSAASQVAAAASRVSAAAIPQPTARARPQGFAGMSVAVYVGNEKITDIARAEVRNAHGELIQVLNAS
ncbi:phage tail tape measure protein [Streptomyces sp. NPDC096324]|uniref:phage tail tape measure protein n=1 Tax=Streptomyces sp. NPDC096324 TaxID=3366085 RepID=UPI00382A9348